MKRIGILGGTFNPIHNGHLAIAEIVCEKMSLDKVLFIPSRLPPHKSGKNILSAAHRLNMVRLAVKDYDHFEASSVETDRQGRSYTVDTLEALRGIYPKGTKFYFILGQDSLQTLPKWKNVTKILDLATFVAVRRSKSEEGLGEEFARAAKEANLSKEIRDKIQKIRIIKMPIMDISSQKMRRRIAANKEVQFYIPAEVDNYIKKNKLYQKNTSRHCSQ